MRSRVLAVLAFLFTLSTYAGDRGLPLVRSYTPEEYQAGAQNFDIAQDARGVLYFANLSGALAFDGAWWHVVELPNHSAVFAIESDAAGHILAGGVGELGILDDNRYRSLSAGRAIGDVNSICRSGQGFIAVTDRMILAGDTSGIRVLDPASHPHQRCFNANGSVYIAADSLYRVDGDRLTLVAPNLAADAIAASNQKLIAVIPGTGIAAIEQGRATPIDSDASTWLKSRRAADAVSLTGGRIAIATQEDGVAIVNSDGTLDQIVDHAAGVPDDVLKAAFVDREGSLWLAAADGSIEQIDLASPITVWDKRLNIRGSARSVFHWNNRLFIANAHGLFSIDRERTPARQILGGSSAWSMLEVPQGLLVSMSNGIMLLDHDEHATLVPGTDRTGGYGMLRPSFDPSHIWFGCRTGLGVLRQTTAGWELERMIGGAPPYVREFAEENGALWAGTTFDGALRIDNAASPQPKLTRLERGETFLHVIRGRVGFVIGRRFLRPQGDRLIEDPLTKPLNVRGPWFHIAEDAQGSLWLNTSPPTVFKKNGNGWSHDGEPIVSITVPNVQSMTCERDGTVWLGSNRGMYRFDANTRAQSAAPPAPLIHRIDAVGTVNDNRTLRHDFRRLRIEFAPVSYRPGVMFQYRLDPADADWSAWSQETFVDFTNLAGGDYTFRVRARAPEGAFSAPTIWRFSVLPPWYATRMAFIVWVLALATAIMLIVRIRTHALHRQAEVLRERIANRTQALNEKNELLEQANARLERLSLVDELTGIANRRYFMRFLGEDWQNAVRDHSSLALIMMDLDHFKELNDRRGHMAGDDCLRRIGEFLGATVRRSGDVAARYGGEEFAVLLVGASESAAVQIAERLRSGIAQLEIPYDETEALTLTVSCGVAAMVPAARATPDTLIERADRALYAAKNSGRNCIRSAA